MALASIVFGLALTHQALAYDNSRNDNLALYWGQNSYGATHGNDQANWQKSLATYCQDDVINAIPLAFLTVANSIGNEPEINFSSTCSSQGGVFPGTNLANCQFMAQDIKTCQAKGKIVTLSIGGATGGVTFQNDQQATTFADNLWNLFFEGSSNTRPFGDAVLDGIDLDIEGGGSTGYAAFVNQIRSKQASKKIYFTAAPQCPFPDANLGAVLNAVGFDAVYVQFYNNFCGLQNFNNPNAWNFNQWDAWAKNTSPNKNVKIFIGAPASPTAAGSGYVDVPTLAGIIQQTKSQFSSFGGVMGWDVSQAYANNRWDQAVKNVLTGAGFAPAPTKTVSESATPTTTKPVSPSAGGCEKVFEYHNNLAYTEGLQVLHDNHIWTAKEWTFGKTPSDSSQWQDAGACSASSSAASSKPTASSKATIPDTIKAKNSRVFRF